MIRQTFANDAADDPCLLAKQKYKNFSRIMLTTRRPRRTISSMGMKFVHSPALAAPLSSHTARQALRPLRPPPTHPVFGIPEECAALSANVTFRNIM
jgi:hypothetical protein